MQLQVEVIDSIQTTSIISEIAMEIPGLEIIGSMRDIENPDILLITVEAQEPMQFYHFGRLMAEKYYVPAAIEAGQHFAEEFFRTIEQRLCPSAAEKEVRP